MQALQERLRVSKSFAPHVTGILSLVIAAEAVMAHVGAVCERQGITRPQMNVLRILRGAGEAGHSRRSIAARMVEHAPDVTRLLDRLVAVGYVERTRSPHDRRESIARITPRGSAFLAELDPEVSMAERQVGDRLSEEEWNQMASLCQKLW